MSGAAGRPGGRPLAVAIDGPAASGKSTTAAGVARELGLLYVDSGAMYRALALSLLRAGVDPADPAAVDRVLAATDLDLVELDGETRVVLDGEDVTLELKQERVAEIASAIAPRAGVRRYLVARQREIAAGRGVVMEGRDIGTVVLPAAPVKIYLVADLEVRAARRASELARRGEAAVDADRVRDAIAERDRRDRERAESPLREAVDAVTIDTSRLTIPEQVARVVAEVERRWGGSRPAPGPSQPPGDPLVPLEVAGFYRFARTTTRVIARILLGFRVEGVEALPASGGFILASNHASALDPPLLGAAATRRLAYLAKEELFRPPVLKQLITALGAFPIRRRGVDRGAMEVAKRVLRGGSGLLLFPEGTRTKNGRLGPSRPGISLLAAESGAPVVPVHIGGTWRPVHALCRRPPVVVRFGPPLAPPPPLAAGTERRHELRAHAALIMQAIAGLADPGRSNPRGGSRSHAR